VAPPTPVSGPTPHLPAGGFVWDPLSHGECKNQDRAARTKAVTVDDDKGAWAFLMTGGLGVASSNLAAPTIQIKELETSCFRSSSTPEAYRKHAALISTAKGRSCSRGHTRPRVRDQRPTRAAGVLYGTRSLTDEVKTWKRMPATVVHQERAPAGVLAP
jgi:hypothetical protein